MEKQKKHAFTLVELIVVITILAILGAIAFISLQGFNADSRDAKRISDMAQFKKGLEVYATETGSYPMPDSAYSILESGEILNYQGVTGDLTAKNARMSDPLTDPLTGEYYEYAVDVKMTTYEIRRIVESDIAASIVNSAFANEYTYKVDGQYNGLFVSTKTGRYIAMPSLFGGILTSNHDLATDGALTMNNGEEDFTFMPIPVSNTDSTTFVTELQAVYESIPELAADPEIAAIKKVDLSVPAEVEAFYEEVFAGDDSSDSSSGGGSITIPNNGISCKSILSSYPSAPDGIYTISTPSGDKDLYCDMTRNGGGWTLVVGIDGLNRNHVNINEVTPSNLSDINGKGKLSDSDINALKTEHYMFTCGSNTQFVRMSSNFVGNAAISPTSSYANYECSPNQTDWYSISGWGTHSGIDTHTSPSCIGITYNADSGNGCAIATGGHGNSGSVWVK